ncbi:fatty acid desaturase [Cupriavidus necator]
MFLLGVVVTILLGDSLLGAHGDGQSHPVSVGLAVPLGFIFLWMLAMFEAAVSARRAAPLDFAGLTVTCGVLSAFATAHIHEVMHRGNRLGKLASDLALTMAGYPHYQMVHQLHHAHVGDPRYGSTADVGMSLWWHVGRSFRLALLTVLRRDRKQIRPGRKSRLLWLAAAWSGTMVAFACFDGTRGILFYLGQSAISVFVVEGIGYIQHYGLGNRAAGGSGQIAWDADSWLFNRLFVNNGLHTHHHLEQTITYDRLRNVGVTLPAGYLHMFVLALVPSLWFSVMDWRLAHSATIGEARKQD